ncbi:maleylpyruvate isomerase family mycothiol-dependent enzyme [Nocardia mexicana]|uniref:Uncharacterized protein (TIGR03083 family) n=1 Tax=Nocardia mexicana TaxID=279262 RepID=A0A370H2S6_9NOCA|nr:maleylpyruvate isomerase family mycothiol-dependent enzyme [Nocardia mexicana]RDI50117.1 uncharacterized protein (TIGR03083 family) [Nocardia mexicana]
MATSMTEDQIWEAVAAERASLVELLRPLPETGWDHPSLCDGWRVRDVVAHLVLSAEPKIGSILINLIRARGNFDRLVRDTAIRHADGRSTPQLLAELHDSVGARITPVGTTPVDRLMDLLVHGQDIAVPLRIPRQMPVDTATLSLNRVWDKDFPFHARKKFGGYRLQATDGTWSAGNGPIVEGSATALLMLITGRDVTREQLTGTGAAQLISE